MEQSTRRFGAFAPLFDIRVHSAATNEPRNAIDIRLPPGVAIAMFSGSAISLYRKPVSHSLWRLSMRGFTLLCCSALLVACAKTEPPPADTTAAAPAAIPEAPPVPAPISLKAVAGKYDVTGKNEAGDS